MEPCAEASISDREHWRPAQSELYYQLTQLWHTGTAQLLDGHGGAEGHVEPPAEPEPNSHTHTWELLEDLCEDHRARPTPRGMARPESPGGSTGAGWKVVPGIAFGGVPVGHLPHRDSWEEKNGAINSSLLPIRH